MKWNWEQSDWPNFRHDAQALSAFERGFLQQGGMLLGAFKHLNADDKAQITVDLMASEAITTSEIEGEILDRDSVQSSIKRQFGLPTDKATLPAAERGIAEMMGDLYQRFDQPLTHKRLHGWHRLLMADRNDLDVIGGYRKHDDPMQVVSGPSYKRKVHFEAPPSSSMNKEMKLFVDWFERTGPASKQSLPALTRAGIAHLHFVSIHPYEDGNGRIARAISEMALAQGLGQACMTALSTQINQHKKAYYAALEEASTENEITPWLIWFSQTVLAAQDASQAWIEFFIEKTKLFDRLKGRINPRQEKALLRMMREGPEGFKGGLSAGNYIRITGVSSATASRDLADLVTLGALRRTGERKATRYWLSLQTNTNR